MSDLHGGRVVITVNDNHLHTEPLQFDDHFLAEFTAAA